MKLADQPEHETYPVGLQKDVLIMPHPVSFTRPANKRPWYLHFTIIIISLTGS